MAQQHETGRAGEALARRYLEGEGYQVLETNWRYSRAEVDLIAMDGAVLVFIEVKTRASDAFGRPEDFVNRKKEKLLALAAAAYMDSIGHEWEVRFDVISILYRHEADFELQHLKDAFFPGLE